MALNTVRARRALKRCKEIEEFNEIFEIWGTLARAADECNDSPLLGEYTNLELGRLMNRDHFEWTKDTPKDKQCFTEKDILEAVHKLEILMHLLALCDDGLIVEVGDGSFKPVPKEEEEQSASKPDE